MTDSNFVAKRVDAGIPIWTLFAYGQDIGCATVFDYDNEGPMATVRYGFHDEPVTFAGSSIRSLLAEVGAYLRDVDADMKAEADAEYYMEVIGPMQAAERAAEMPWQGDEYPDWF